MVIHFTLKITNAKLDETAKDKNTREKKEHKENLATNAKFDWKVGDYCRVQWKEDRGGDGVIYEGVIVSVGKIEGLKRCESLNKLDLTLNFIDVEDLQESLENLEWCPLLDELTLTGNPCTDWPKYREYTIAKVPQLKRLDGDLNGSGMI